MEEFLALTLWLGVELALIQSGRLAVRALSLNRWRAERMRDEPSRPPVAAGALWFKADGVRVVTINGSRLLGIALLAAGVAVFVVR